MSFKTIALIFLISFIPRLVLIDAILLKNNGDLSVSMVPDVPRYYNRAVMLTGKYAYFYGGTHSESGECWDVPLYPIFLAFFFKLFCPSILLAVFLNIFLFSLSACILYKIAVNLFGNYTGFIATIIFAFYPSLLGQSLIPLAEPLFLLLFLSCIYFFILFLKQEKMQNLILSSIFLGSATLTKEAVLFFPLIMMVLILFKHRRNLKKTIKALFFLTVVYLAVLSPSLIYNYKVSKTYTISSKVAVYSRFLNWKIKTHRVDRPVNPFLSVINYFNERKHFFGGTGTLTMMRLLGYDVSLAETVIAKSHVKYLTPVEFLKVIQKEGKGWATFQILAWIFISFVYMTSFLSIFRLFMKKRFSEAIFIILAIAHFLVVYFYHWNSRYFTLIVPFLALLSAYYLSGIVGIIFRKDKIKYAVG